MEAVVSHTTPGIVQQGLLSSEKSNGLAINMMSPTFMSTVPSIRYYAPRDTSALINNSNNPMASSLSLSTPIIPSTSTAVLSARKDCHYNHKANSKDSLAPNQKSVQIWNAFQSPYPTQSPLAPLNVCLLGDKYIVSEQIDGGNLFKCRDVMTNTPFICKISNKPCTNLLTAHFRLDGHVHVNQIVKVIDGGRHYYLFFKPSQGDLHSHVRTKKRIGEYEARSLFYQMCKVVKSCHEVGIVLRDLKLRKFVFIDREKKMIKLETLEDTIVLNNLENDLLQNRRGCPAYVSPELLKANTQYSGKAADMWSLGVILYTMLIGRYPFNDSEHASLFAKISRGIYQVPECISARARCLIRCLLRRDPCERILSDDILAHPWFVAADLNRDSNQNFIKEEDHVVPTNKY